jgi:hypothetical protein
VKAAIIELVVHNLHGPELLGLLAIVSSEASEPERPAHGWSVKRYEYFAAELERLLAHDASRADCRPMWMLNRRPT